MDALFVNNDTMMSAEVEIVAPRKNGNRYRVILRDLDADRIVYPIHFFSTMEQAKAIAELVMEGKK